MHKSHPSESNQSHVVDGRRRGEDVLRASGLGYTVVRPGPLREEPGGYRALVFDQGNRISHAISCADVADVALKVGRQNGTCTRISARILAFSRAACIFKYSMYCSRQAAGRPLLGVDAERFSNVVERGWSGEAACILHSRCCRRLRNVAISHRRRRCTTAPRATRRSRCAPRWRRNPGRRRMSWWRTSPIAPTTTSPPRS